MPPPSRRITVFGAGALALGFLGPELYPDYQLTFVDIPAKAHLLGALSDKGAFSVNISSSFREVVTVTGCRGLRFGRDDEEIVSTAADSDILFTAVGAANLQAIAPIVAEAVRRRCREGEAANVLCCENGNDVAGGFRALIADAGGPSASDLHVADTVMGRMCRIEELAAPPHVPVAAGLDWAVVAEPIYGIPVQAGEVSDSRVFSAAFQLCSDGAFAARDDFKTYVHNGIHAFLAFLGSRRGYSTFADAGDDTELMTMAWRVLREEMASALTARHGDVFDRGDYLNYATGLLRRLVCPYFGDELWRGTRCALRKLAPNERFVSGARLIASADVCPEVFCRAMAAAVVECIGSGGEYRSVDELLERHCRLDIADDAVIFEAVRRGVNSLVER